MLNNSSMESTSGDGFYLKLPLGFTIFQFTLQIAICVFGVIGNAVVCAKIIRGTRAFSVLSPYLLSLAFADLGILLLNYPLLVLKIQFPREWFFGELACLYIFPFTETFFGACIWSITAIAAERYVKIAWKFTVPIQSGGRRSSRRIQVIVIAIWVISFIVMAVPLYVYQTYDSGKQPPCFIEYPPSLQRSLTAVNTILMYVLPLVIISFSYQRIGKIVTKRTLKLQNQTPDHSRDSKYPALRVNTDLILMQTRKTQRILKPLVILFAVTMLPYQIFMLTMVYWGETFVQRSYYFILMAVVSISVATNSAADPLVYCVTNKEFRQEIKVALPRCFRAGQNHGCRNDSLPLTNIKDCHRSNLGSEKLKRQCKRMWKTNWPATVWDTLSKVGDIFSPRLCQHRMENAPTKKSFNRVNRSSN